MIKNFIIELDQWDPIWKVMRPNMSNLQLATWRIRKCRSEWQVERVINAIVDDEFVICDLSNLHLKICAFIWNEGCHWHVVNRERRKRSGKL